MPVSEIMGAPEDMVLAGSRPSNSPGASPIDALHRRTSFVLLIDNFVLFLIISQFVGLPLTLVPGLVGMTVWIAYKQKSPWAYWFAPLIMGFTSLLFLIFIAVQVYALIALGTGSFLITLIIAWAAYSSIRFIRIHFHPVYRMGYLGYGVQNQGTVVQPNEILAACPNCLAVLAINPHLLSPKDRCPHCDSSLVLDHEEE